MLQRPNPTLTGVCRLSGLSPDFLRKLMRASGRPTAAPRQRAYTDDDVELGQDRVEEVPLGVSGARGGAHDLGNRSRRPHVERRSLDQVIFMPEIARAITSRWISAVPSKIS